MKTGSKKKESMKDMDNLMRAKDGLIILERC